MAAEHTVQRIAKLVGDFVARKKGAWKHADWEKLCTAIGALDIELNDELQERLGVVLENMKVFYFCAPPAAPAKRKPKAKAKRKATAKVKTTAKAALAPRSTDTNTQAQ